MPQGMPAALGGAGRDVVIGTGGTPSDTTVSEPRKGEASSQRPLRLIAWRRVRSGALRGFANIELPIGLLLYDVPVFAGVDGAWAGLPRRRELDRERRQKTALKAAWWPLACEWRSRELQDRWSAAAVALIRAAHPEDLP